MEIFTVLIQFCSLEATFARHFKLNLTNYWHCRDQLYIGMPMRFLVFVCVCVSHLFSLIMKIGV